MKYSVKLNSMKGVVAAHQFGAGKDRGEGWRNSSTKGPMAYSHCSLFLQKLLICQCHTALGVSRKTTAGGESAEARALLGADPGASVAELLDAGDSHSPGMLQVQARMPCGFDSRLGHHQPAGARQEQGRPTPLSKRSYREPCQQPQ